MKKAKPTVAEIHSGLNQFQKELLEEIWQHFRTKGQWPTLRGLYSKHGKQKISKALADLGKGIGSEESSGHRWIRYQISLLGALLTKDGLRLHALMDRFFQFQRKQFKTDPLKEQSTSAEIASALKLNEEETVLLGQLLRLANFGGGGVDKEWSVSAMEEAADFPKTGDLSAQVDEWARRYYRPRTLATQQRPPSLQFPDRQSISFGNLTTATPDQPHFSEIKASLDRLRIKYPDPTKLGFLIMRFTEGKPFERIVNVIKRTAEKHGLIIIRANDGQFHAHLWENVKTLLHGCGFGIAVYERIERDEPNANVGLEVGYLMAMNTPVLLLKDKSVDALQSDLAGKLYKPFDPYEPEKTIPNQLTTWLEDNGIIVPKRT